MYLYVSTALFNQCMYVSLVTYGQVFFGGRASCTACMNEQVGFTPACVPCWVDNIVCDQSACVFTCLWSLLRGEKNNRDLASADLSTCLKCDEVWLPSATFFSIFFKNDLLGF